MIKVSKLVRNSKYFWNFFQRKFILIVKVTGSQLRENIRKVAKSRGYSINGLCEKLNITRNGFDYAFNNMSVKVSLIFDIAEVLNTHYRKLIEGPEVNSNTVHEPQAQYGEAQKKYTEALEEIRGLYQEISKLKDENARLREELAALQGGEDKKKEAS